jgi:hypothetical protein
MAPVIHNQIGRLVLRNLADQRWQRSATCSNEGHLNASSSDVEGSEASGEEIHRGASPSLADTRARMASTGSCGGIQIKKLSGPNSSLLLRCRVKMIVGAPSELSDFIIRVSYLIHCGLPGYNWYKVIMI